MRKQNSTFKTAFISEAGSGLENNDYFAYVELDQYACYVIADGLNDLPDAESARLATQTIILAFEEHPSIKKRTVLSLLEAANKALAKSDRREKLKASVTVVVTDYVKVRYGYAGNTRLRFYRDGAVKEQTRDMSLGTQLIKERELPEDTLSRHEQRNNLYTYLGQGKGFHPFVSKKLSLVNGDILTLYSRGIWENLDNGELDDVFSEAKDDPQESLDNIEDLLLSRQPEDLENYTFASIFVDKVYLDPNRKRRIKKMITAAVVVLAVVLVVSLVLWLLNRQRHRQMEELELRYSNMIEYIQDDNFLRAKEECGEALKLAEKLKIRKEIQEISDYQKLIEAVNAADDAFSSGNYKDAQPAYVTAKERSRYADRVADGYIDRQLSHITDYLSVFDYIQLGDTLAAQGDYERAEEKYLQAKSLATRTYFAEGRKDAIDALEAMYASRDQAEEADTQEAKARASSETGAAQLASDGDKAFSEGDYEGARVFYAMALEKYLELGDTAHAELLQTRIVSSGQKAEENQQKKQQAEDFVLAGKGEEAAGNKLEAKKQYLFAKNLYKELKLDDKVVEVEGLIEILETAMEQEQAEKESLEAEEAAQSSPGEAEGSGGEPGPEMTVAPFPEA
ncbi:MAG: hypothetical protein HFG62_09765 [Lachnospiraceae bacterium]|nr:hypothetical protein [Lachnospiraceae bacterium]